MVEHYVFSSEAGAKEAYRRMFLKGWMVSQPWKDEHGTWKITHVI